MQEEQVRTEDRWERLTPFYWLNKHWQAKAEHIAMQDERYRILMEKYISSCSADGGTDLAGLKLMHERYKLRHELAPQPKYFTFFRWKKEQKYKLSTSWHKLKFNTLHWRTNSQYWHFMHNELWACPDCDSLRACPDQRDDPNHLCTAQIVDIDDLDDDDLDETDSRPWLDKAICWSCGYTGRLAQKQRRRGKHT